MADDAAMELRRRLRALPKVEWWIWSVGDRDPDGPRVVRRVQLPWPYVQPPKEERPDAGWGKLWVLQSLSHVEINAALVDVLGDVDKRARERLTKPSYLRATDFDGGRDHSLGRMFCVLYEAYGYGRGAWRWLVTPPVYRFCDVDKEFPEARIAPADYWVQPEVLRETGEVLQGSPVDPSNTEIHGWLPRGTNLHARAPYDERYDFIVIALDAWLENYERTGSTIPNERFAWTFAEQRERAAQRIASSCAAKGCPKKPRFRVRLRSMQSWSNYCAQHAREQQFPEGTSPSEWDEMRPDPDVIVEPLP